MSDLIVIIDNWKYKPDGTMVTGELGRNIINFIESTPAIKTAVLASYSCSRELFSDTIWYLNRKQFVENYEEYVFEDYQTNLNRNMQTWDTMLNYVNPNIFQIAMRDIDELVNYVKIHTVKNIYISGATWEICVRYRPLGYENIIKTIPNINLFTDTSCVVDSTSTFLNSVSGPDWKKISNSLYQYQNAAI